MDHGIADFHTGGITVEQHAADLLFQQGQNVAQGVEFGIFADQGGGQLTAQTVQRLEQPGLVSDFDHDGGRAKDFFLQ
ncbi:hypothetical protein D3C84_942010 [compost metagenome]